MISSSVTLVARKAAKNYSQSPSYVSTSQGCSEFPAHCPDVVWYVSLNTLMLQDSGVRANLTAAFGADYTTKQYTQDWTAFVMEIFKEINAKSDVPLFSLYTVVDLKRELASSENFIKLTDNGTNIPSTVKKEDDNYLLGIKTHCSEIRKLSNCDYYSEDKKDVVKTATGTLCRKVQLAHTILRLGWSSGILTALISLKLWKMNVGIHPLYCLWAGYKLRFSVYKSYSDYGDAFLMNSDFLSSDGFVNNFFDKSKAGRVQAHFMRTENPLFADLMDFVSIKDDTHFGQEVMGKKTGVIERDFAFKNSEVLKIGETEVNRIIAIIAKEEAAYGKEIDKCKFAFNKKLFRSVVINEPYEAWVKPESKLGRLVFKDEEGSCLSVLKGSKSIDILK